MSGNPIEIGGALTLDRATAVLQTGCNALAASTGDAVFDLGRVEAVDSSGLAVVFAWLREAHASGRKVVFTRPPQQLLSLAAVYGVSDMLPLA
ncbi:MAG: STAS domain-containing protein [Rhodocyclaceae bacterium]|jgi:phospholipid transport system transporter-binding protein|nr:STAS domain-containing protein [Rhodocyclaceae bacterium]